MKDNKKVAMIFGALAVFVFLAVYIGITVTKNIGKSGVEISAEKAESRLERLADKVSVKNVEARKASVQLGTNTLADELPDISKYPLSVEGRAPLNIEIFSSPEKAGDNYDGFLIEMANAFNAQRVKAGGTEVSVSIRSISSGMGMDYIVSGKYLPDAFTPSNELWGKLIEAEGGSVTLEESRLVGNVAGILLKKKKYDKLVDKYGSINMKTITQATADSQFAMGYTNPYSSSTGLNFLLGTLNAYDSADLLSDKAVKGFEEFQKQVPFVAYTTMQMRDAADTGVLDGMILEYQTYKNTRELKDYSFTPFGVRHDNPIYSVGSLSAERKEALRLFIDFCLNESNQKIASDYGFNQLDDYVSEQPDFDGVTIKDAQSLWKENKDNGRPVTAVFVADVSGSMDGAPIAELKNSLINASSYIKEDSSIGLVSYNSRVYCNLPIGKFDLNQRSLFTGAVEDLSAIGGTATFDAVTVALDMLMKEKEKNPDTKLMLFVLSDGETNQGYDLDDVKSVIQGLEIPVYTIGYNANISALEAISSINEAASINADSDDVIYKLKSLFNAQM